MLNNIFIITIITTIIVIIGVIGITKIFLDYKFIQNIINFFEYNNINIENWISNEIINKRYNVNDFNNIVLSENEFLLLKNKIINNFEKPNFLYNIYLNQHIYKYTDAGIVEINVALKSISNKKIIIDY